MSRVPHYPENSLHWRPPLGPLGSSPKATEDLPAPRLVALTWNQKRARWTGPQWKSRSLQIWCFTKIFIPHWEEHLGHLQGLLVTVSLHVPFKIQGELLSSSLDRKTNTTRQGRWVAAQTQINQVPRLYTHQGDGSPSPFTNQAEHLRWHQSS